MADINITTRLTAAVANKESFNASSQFTAGWTNPRGMHNQQEVLHTAAAEIQFASGINTPRWILLRNLDDTNYVQIGPDNTGMVPFIRLAAGQECVLPLNPSVTLMAQADTDTVELDVTVLDT